METTKTIHTIAGIAQHLLDTGAISTPMYYELLKCERNMMYRMYKLHEQLETKKRDYEMKLLVQENQALSEGKRLQAQLISSLQTQLNTYIKNDSSQAMQENSQEAALNSLIERYQSLHSVILEVLTERQLQLINERLNQPQ